LVAVAAKENRNEHTLHYNTIPAIFGERTTKREREYRFRLGVSSASTILLSLIPLRKGSSPKLLPLQSDTVFDTSSAFTSTLPC
jgi:hypothetical protein